MAESRPFLASAYRIRRFVCEYALADRPHTFLWLAKTYVVPAGMYGSQVWGTAFLQAGRGFSSSLSTLHLHFLKGTLGVKRSTTNWAVLRECGHEPLQFYWFRSAVKPFNSMLNKSYKGYKDGLQPESLADGNWLVKQKQPVSKIETKSDTNLRSLYES